MSTMLNKGERKKEKKKKGERERREKRRERRAGSVSLVFDGECFDYYDPSS